MKTRSLAVLFVCLLAVTACLSAADSEAVSEQNVDVNGVDFYCNDSVLELNARSSATITITISNNSGHDMLILISNPTQPDGVSTNIQNGRLLLVAGDHTQVQVEIITDRYAPSEVVTVPLQFSVSNMDVSDSTAVTGTMDIGLTVTSAYESEGRFNMILGFIANPIESLNNPTVNTIITAIIWLALAVASGLVIDRIIQGRKKLEKDSKQMKDVKWVGRMLGILILLYGAANCLSVFGADEYFVGTFSDVAEIVAYFIVAFMAWKAYKVIIYIIVVKRDTEDRIDDSLLPLFNMIGEIVIAIYAVTVILSVIGLDFAAIVTSAGLVTLGISLGAQNTLNQFFSGLLLMINRPFRIGDKIKLGTGGEVLIVRRISVMQTEFKNWLNEEITRIPNSTVMSSTIINITMDDKAYKVYDYFDVSYDADIEKARQIIMDTVNAHPQVITDGSKPKPSFRFNTLDGSSIKLRVSYIVPDHENYETISGQIKEAVFRRFRAEGIKIPHTVIDVHVRE